MKNSEQYLLNILNDLKENHNVIGVKTEFETEGTSIEEAKKLGELVQLANLDYTIKIGGCGALNDLLNTRKINCKSIVAPMIESEYALKKFIQTTQKIYTKDELQNINLYINIETITGYKNLKQIINAPDFSKIKGIILGRNDLVSSMNLDKCEVNSDTILEITNVVAKELETLNKTLIIGGCVDEESIDFFNKINSTTFKAFETRKIVFQKGENLSRKSIQKAIEFELNWLKSKTENNTFDIERINYLETIFVK